MEQEYLTPRQVAQRLRVDYTTVLRWISTGLLDVETIREGRRNRHRIRKVTIDTLETHLPPPCAGYLAYPFENKREMSNVENLARYVDKEEKI